MRLSALAALRRDREQVRLVVTNNFHNLTACLHKVNLLTAEGIITFIYCEPNSHDFIPSLLLQARGHIYVQFLTL